MKSRPSKFSTFRLHAGIPILFLFILAVSCSNSSSMNQQTYQSFSVTGETTENSYTRTPIIGHSGFILKNLANSSINVEVKEVILIAGEQKETIEISSVHVFNRNEEKALESPIFEMSETSELPIFVSFPEVHLKDTKTDTATVSVTFSVNGKEYKASSKIQLVRRIPVRRN